jgi:hypothetical protein
MRMKAGFAVLLVGALQPGDQVCALDLEAGLTRVITNKVYHDPTASQVTRANELFQRTLLGDRTTTELQTNWAALGFEFSVVTNGGDCLWLLHEPGGNQSGRGWYLFRPGHQSKIILESPHPKNDVHTGIIGLRLFLAGPIRAYAVSTVTRHRADIAHLGNTFFQAFTLAFSEVCSTGAVVQLHGFELTNHEGTEADVVASAGTDTPEPWFNDFVQNFKKTTPLRVLAYPQDIRQLGARTNAQGKALQKSGRCRFLHLEFSLELRERLTRDSQLRGTLLNCLETTEPK